MQASLHFSAENRLQGARPRRGVRLPRIGRRSRRERVSALVGVPEFDCGRQGGKSPGQRSGALFDPPSSGRPRFGNDGAMVLLRAGRCLGDSGSREPFQRCPAPKPSCCSSLRRRPSKAPLRRSASLSSLASPPRRAGDNRRSGVDAASRIRPVRGSIEAKNVTRPIQWREASDKTVQWRVEEV